MISLRPYQLDAKDRIVQSFRAGHRAPLLVLPTGGGKTVVFCYMAKNASDRGKRVYILVHRKELVDQVSRTLSDFQVPHSFIAASRAYDSSRSVQVCSVQTIVGRHVPAPDLIIVDEAHHAVAGSWRKVSAMFPRAQVVGVTATPQRLDGRGLGDVFDDLIVGPSVSDLMEIGALCEYRLYAPPGIDTRGLRTVAGDYSKSDLSKAADKPSVTGDAVAHYRRLADGLRAIVFCVSVSHAKHVAGEFQAAGYQSGVIEGALSHEIRTDLVQNFRSGRIQVLTSVDVVSEGFDLPAIECAISLRPTQSLILWLQQVGRALRPFQGKPHAIILDHAGNTERHGLPDDDRQWSLDSAKRTAKGANTVLSARTCPICFAAFRQGPTCPYCGEVMPIVEAVPEQRDGELVEVEAARAKREFLRRRGAAKTLEELIQFAIEENYRDPEKWARAWLQIRRKYTHR